MMKNFSETSYRQTNGNLLQDVKKSYFMTNGSTIFSSSTVGEFVDDAAIACGDDTAFTSVHQGISKTFLQFRNEVKKLASGFIALGLTKGDRIAICCPNSYEWPLVQFAAAKAGLILVALNPAYQSREMESCLNNTKCSALVIWDKLKTQDFYQILCKIAPELPKCKPGHLTSTGVPDLKIVVMVTEEPNKGVMALNEVLDSGNPESDTILEEIEKQIQFDDPVCIMFTSGTTGAPKGAVLTHHNIVNNMLIFGKPYSDDMRQIICCPVPCFHAFGCVLGTLLCVMYRYRCVFPSILHDPKATLDSIEKFGCTTVYGTPTMYVDMIRNYEAGNYKIRSINKATIGGAPLDENLVSDILLKLNVSYIQELYGMTEASPIVATKITNNKNCSHNMAFSILEYNEAKIINKNGKIVPVNTDGELCVRGYNVFNGYWENKKKMEEVLDKARWLHTGDSAVMDECGRIRINGRFKDMIIRGGENIYPAEIESTLSEHPSVAEAQAVGVPDQRMGEEICACVILKGNGNLTDIDVKEFCRGKLSHFKIPRYVIFLNDFPKTASGKIRKNELQIIAKEKLSL